MAVSLHEQITSIFQSRLPDKTDESTPIIRRLNRIRAVLDSRPEEKGWHVRGLSSEGLRLARTTIHHREIAGVRRLTMHIPDGNLAGWDQIFIRNPEILPDEVRRRLGDTGPFSLNIKTVMGDGHNPGISSTYSQDVVWSSPRGLYSGSYLLANASIDGNKTLWKDLAMEITEPGELPNTMHMEEKNYGRRRIGRPMNSFEIIEKDGSRHIAFEPGLPLGLLMRFKDLFGIELQNQLFIPVGDKLRSLTLQTLRPTDLPQHPALRYPVTAA